MSRHFFCSYKQRATLLSLTQVVGVLAVELANDDDHSLSSDDDDNSDDDSDDNSDDDSDDEDSDDDFDERNEMANLVNQGLAAIALLQAEINQPIENANIAWGRRLRIADWSDAECLDYTRFRKVDLQQIADLLWPKLLPYLGDGATKDRIILSNRNVAPYETLLLLYFCRLSRPSRLRPDMEIVFGMRRNHLSRAIDHFSAALYQVARPYMTDPSIWHERMPYYAMKIQEKCRVLNCVWGFIDGTFRRSCRPKRYQRQCYSGHKKAHGLKFQGVVTPDGYFACLHGIWPGHRHDATMLQQSGLIEQLTELMPEDGTNGPVYAMHGDSAYPRSRYLLGGFRNPPANSRRAAFNAYMSKGRISVEWGFNLVTKYWSFVDFVPANRILLSPCGRHYYNACFLANLHNCVYMNQTSAYFGCNPLSVNDYLNLVE